MLLVGGGLALYTLTQPTPAPRPLRTLTNPATARATTGESIRGVGSGEHAWVKRYESGELHSQFRGDKYEPQKDGTVHVVRPQAEFFATEGRQRVRIEGITGDIVTQLPPEQNDGRLQSRGADMTTPTRGTLQDVSVSVYEPADAAEPILVARMNNASFDTDKFRIATQSYTDAAGNKIEAENVPVIVRGRDYDFDGKGLIIGWNERDRKLTLLEVTHGEQLVVKNSSMLSAPLKAAPTTEPTASTSTHAAAERQRRRGPLLLASTDFQSAGLILAAAKPATRRRPPGRLIPPPLPAATSRPVVKPDLSPVVYRATFEKNVRIFEGDKQIGTLDQMNIDILQVPTDDAATQPAPTTARSHKRKPADALEPATTKSSTTSRGPITVKWSGKLRVVPLEGTPDPNLVPDKPIVRMTGAPAILMLNGSEARCGTLIYNSADSSAILAQSAAFPFVTLKDTGGAHITTPQLNYSRMPNGEAVATLIGKSRAEFPVDSAGQTPELITATWLTDGRMLMTDIDGKAVMQQIDLTGDVNVEHPQLNLKGKLLSLTFDPPGSSPSPGTPGEGRGEGSAPANPTGAIREILASGDVKCQILDEKQPRSIDAQRLRVLTARTPQNKTYAKRIEADGEVVTTENRNQLRAGHLAAELEPSTQPVASTADTPTGLAGGDVKLIALDARDDVRLSTPDGAQARGDTLTLDRIGAAQAYRLSGSPATVTDGKNTIKGREIRIAPDINLAEIPKGGSFEGASPDDPRQTVKVQWAGVATLNGETDFLDVDEQVVMTTTMNDGTINAAKSKHLRAKLEAKPTTAPATKVATTKQPDPRVAFMNGKQITKATLTGDVEVKSELNAPDGSILRGINLFAQIVTYDQLTRRFEVPAKGEMIYRDHRPAEAKEKKPEGPSIGSGRGDTAFKWAKNLVYDPDAAQAVMSGDVVVVHNPIGNGQAFNINAQTLTATLQPDTKVPTTNPSAAAANIKVKRVTAAGDVHVQSKRLNFDGPNLAYEPDAQILMATGDANHPVTVYDNESGSTSQAGELWWNTQTDQFKIKKFTGKVRQ